MTASRVTISQATAEYFVWGITELGSEIVVGALEKKASNFNVGVITVDKSTLARVGHFTSSNVYNSNSD